MSILLWMLAGAAIGWIGYAILDFNEGRGQLVSIVIGVVGGLLGGKVLAPMFTAATVVPGDVSAAALAFAAGTAAALLAAGNFIENRWGV